MRRKLTDNISLKIMSVAVAVLLWLIVVNIDNPVETKYYPVPSVELINKDYIESAETGGKMCMPEQNQASIRVAITAPRKTQSRIKASDISAYADLQQAVSLSTKPVMVPITASCPGIAAENIKVTPQNLSVYLDDKETQEFMVSVTRDEGKPGKDYEVGSLTANPEKVRITGPKSLVNKIDKVTATVNVAGKNQDVTQEKTLVIFDRNQEKLSDSEMNSLRIENNGKVIVTAKLWRVRKDVRISAGYVGLPAWGYQAGEVKTVPETISVAGSTEALEQLADRNNTIEIPAESIDISGEETNVELKVSLTDILPAGIRLTSDSSEDVWVTVNILPTGSEAFDFPTTDIEVKNKPDEAQVTFETAQIEIRIRSEKYDLKNLNIAEDIEASIDLKDKKVGEYKVPVTIKLPEGYEVVEDVETEVVISEGSAGEEINTSGR